jgi:2-C-methyl-D-erythritol 2,4-cyclodiphosphate synthase
VNLRIGHGFDVHAFSEEAKLILGGVEIAERGGLLGHSDADVVLHSVTDAILGALAWGDIGTWFPDTDAKYENADSSKLLLEVWAKAKSAGWDMTNCDLVVMAQKPKLQSHVPAMRERIAAILGIDSDQVGVKATTTERLGFVGREEGIACSSVVLLSKEAT